MTEGERVKEVRTALGLTLEKFGAALNVTKVDISNIENGNRTLTDRMCADICRVYNVNEMWLRTGEGEMFRKVSHNEEVARFLGDILSDDIGREFKTRFIWALSQLPAESWLALAELIDLYNQAPNSEK